MVSDQDPDCNFVACRRGDFGYRHRFVHHGRTAREIRCQMKFRWTLATPQPLLAEPLAAQLKISPLLSQCLLNRGLSEPDVIENFLAPRLKNLSDPILLPNMTVAVERLL